MAERSMVGPPATRSTIRVSCTQILVGTATGFFVFSQKFSKFLESYLKVQGQSRLIYKKLGF